LFIFGIVCYEYHISSSEVDENCLHVVYGHILSMQLDIFAAVV